MNFSTLNTIGITGGVVAAIVGMSLGAMTAKAHAAEAFTNAKGDCPAYHESGACTVRLHMIKPERAFIELPASVFDKRPATTWVYTPPARAAASE